MFYNHFGQTISYEMTLSLSWKFHSLAEVRCQSDEKKIQWTLIVKQRELLKRDLHPHTTPFSPTHSLVKENIPSITIPTVIFCYKNCNIMRAFQNTIWNHNLYKQWIFFGHGMNKSTFERIVDNSACPLHVDQYIKPNCMLPEF